MTDIHDQTRPRGRPALAPEARNEALVAAGALLAEQGLKGMKARTIAARAGLSVGSIYKLFGDIDDLIRELNVLTYRDVALHHHDALAAAGLDAADVHGRLMVLARAYIDFIINNDARWRALLTFNRRNTGEAPRYYTQHEDQLFHIITDVLEPAPGFAEPAARETAARAIWAAVHGIVLIVLPNARYDDPVATAMTQIEMIVGAFIRDAAAHR
ncbi:TetR/AcrR family transcriptional regulator [Maricaulis sp.]|uniref:TetR/AcrR family transcriptional regulator n=1 Tax=Maricaulis sp. TaxID=1486257 RepID=UPI0025BBA8F2|nr:TetR/AcrR family transcriptional regulator [Maricaulis sp.]